MPTKQTIISGTSDDPSNAATEYSCLMGDGNISWMATEARPESIFPTSGKLTNFKVGVKTAPGNGKSWTFTVRLEDANHNMQDTALSVAISGVGAISALDTDEVTVAAGQRVSIKSSPTGTPTACDAVYWRCDFIPDTDGETILLGNSTGSYVLNNYYYGFIGGGTITSTEFNGQMLFPTSGVIKNFFVELTAAPGNGTSRILTVRKNSVATALVVTISNTNTTGNDIDPDHNVAIAAGDKITILSTLSGSPASTLGDFSIVFLPDIQGEWIASATTDDAISNTDTEYQHLNCGDSKLNGDETQFHGLAPETTAKKIYVNLSVDPGTSPNAYSFTLRRNAITTTNLTKTIVADDTFGNAAVDVDISADDLLDTMIVPISTPSATPKSQIAYLFYNAPWGEIVAPTVTTQAVTDIEQE